MMLRLSPVFLLTKEKRLTAEPEPFRRLQFHSFLFQFGLAPAKTDSGRS